MTWDSEQVASQAERCASPSPLAGRILVAAQHDGEAPPVSGVDANITKVFETKAFKKINRQGKLGCSRVDQCLALNFLPRRSAGKYRFCQFLTFTGTETLLTA